MKMGRQPLWLGVFRILCAHAGASTEYMRPVCVTGCRRLLCVRFAKSVSSIMSRERLRNVSLVIVTRLLLHAVFIDYCAACHRLEVHAVTRDYVYIEHNLQCIGLSLDSLLVCTSGRTMTVNRL